MQRGLEWNVGPRDGVAPPLTGIAGRHERALRNFPLELRAKYFTEVAGGWKIAPELHARVRWSLANITDPAAVAPLARTPVMKSLAAAARCCATPSSVTP